MKKARKILSTLLVYCIVMGVLPTFALAIGQDYVWLDELQIVDSDRYTGNMGDSFIDKIGTRNGTIDTEGNRYSHGLEAWIARWNYKNESSWAWCTYDLNGKYDTLSGTIGILTESYNKTNFDTTLEIWGDNNLLYSLALHPNMTNQEITVNVAGVDTLKINLYDNESVSGGTSFSLGGFRLYMDDAGKLIEESGDKNNDGAETGKFSFQGHTYQVFDDPLTWEDAKISCEAKGGYLATITTQEEQDFVNALLSTSSAYFYWLGGTDERTEGSWEWVTGEPWSYENWRSGQPDNHSDLSDRQEDYLTIQPGIDRWNDLQNDGDPSGDCVLENGGYICEWSSEIFVGYDVDSEGRVVFQGHTYQVIDQSLTWEEAKQACAQRGGHLATITSEMEQEAVAYAISSGTKEAYWLGGTDEMMEGHWKWITGENWSYDNWASGNPDNYQSENFLGILRTSQSWANNSGAAYTWNDFSNRDATMMGYVCEMEASEAGKFTDVSSTDYFAPYVSWAVENGITTGTSVTTFSPHTTCTVAQIITFLWRAEGAPVQKIANPFKDVTERDYFYQPALWAYQSGLVSGNRFAGNKPCTRAMTVLYLWTLAGKPSEGVNPFSDVPNYAEYAQAVAWAVDQGVTTGTSSTTFSPNQTCTRAQIVTFLYRYISLNLPELNANEVNIYAGPGENYQFVGMIEESEIREYIREENNWIEVEYQNRRAYVRESSLTNLEISLLPYVASAPVIGPTQRPYVVFFSNLERKLTCETPIQSGPGSSYAKIDTLESGATLKILYENQSSTNININPFLLVEYQTSEGLKRGYAERNTVLDVHNPLRGFDNIKENNSAFDYHGNTYYSTAAYPYSLDGWTTQYSDSLVDYQFDLLAAITGAISSNDNDIDLVEEVWLYNSKADANVAVNKTTIGNANAFIDLFGIVNAALTSGNQNMAIKVDLETYEDEGRLIIRGGTPFESQHAGKKNLSLSSLIAQSGSALAVLESDKRVDELIRSICPEITGDAQCTLLLTFSDDFTDNPYGYYFVIDKSGRVYSQIIIHPGTQFNVYQNGQLITDIAPRLSRTLMELDTERGNRIIEILSDNGIIQK